MSARARARVRVGIRRLGIPTVPGRDWIHDYDCDFRPIMKSASRVRLRILAEKLELQN